MKRLPSLCGIAGLTSSLVIYEKLGACLYNFRCILADMLEAPDNSPEEYRLK
jgi:hypothetical protein